MRKAPEDSPHSPHSRLTLSRGSGGSDASRGSNNAHQLKPDAVPQAKNQSELARKLLIAPHISEKATMLGESRYVFKIANGANKPLIKKAIKDRYGVTVESVSIIAAQEKKRRRGAILGVKPGFKKAVVTLKTGETIAEF